MSQKNLILLIGGAVLLGVLWWAMQYMPAVEPQAVDPGSTQNEEGEKEYNEKTDLYSIEITYPVNSNAAAQARVEAIIAEEIDRFKTESVGIIDDREAARLREQGRQYQLDIDYKPYSFSTFISYEFDIYLDTGGAHPNAFYRTVTFNAAGEELRLEDLFVDGAAYLPRLSEEAYTRVLAALAVRAGGEVTPDMEEWVRMGTAPSPEALQFFYLSNNALHLLFPPYQVAAYAAGLFDVAIPLSALQDILKSEIR